MKRDVFVCICLGCAITSQAQTERGTITVGGNLDYSSSLLHYTTNPNYGNMKTSSFTIGPVLLYFVVRNLAVGVNAPYSISTSEQPTVIPQSEPSQTTTTSSVGPVIRYYFPIGKWAIFPEASMTWGNGTDPLIVNSNQVVKMSGTLKAQRIGLGATYFLNSKVGVEGLVFYQSNSKAYQNQVVYLPSEITSDSFNFKVGFQFYFHRN